MIMQPAGFSDGCTMWRFDWIRTALVSQKKAYIEMSTQPPHVFFPDPKNAGSAIVNPLLVNTNAVVTQRPTSDYTVDQMKRYASVQKNMIEQGNQPFRCVFDVDDITHGDHISKFNMARDAYEDNSKFKIFKEAMNYVDELHVCSPSMRDFYADEFNSNKVTFRPNLMPNHLFGRFFDMNKIEKRFHDNQHKPRVMWAGSWSHIDVRGQTDHDDFDDFEQLVITTIDEYQWIFYGGYPIWAKSYIDSGKIEYYKWTGIYEFPQKFDDIGANVVFAPLHDNVFNRCKSNIKLTEAGIFGVVGIFQDMDPYVEAPLRFNTSDEFHDHLKAVMGDWDVYRRVVLHMHKIAEEYLMNNNIELLQACYFTEIGSIDRQLVSPKLVEINA